MFLKTWLVCLFVSRFVIVVGGVVFFVVCLCELFVCVVVFV